jgi:nicotinamidase/pyrazinamidase
MAVEPTSYELPGSNFPAYMLFEGGSNKTETTPLPVLAATQLCETKKTVFWDEDTQVDFMLGNLQLGNETYHGKLYVQNAEDIIPNLRCLTQLARERGIKRIKTADDHDENTTETSDEPDFVTTYPHHCMRGTLGAEFIPETDTENPYIIPWNAQSLDYSKLFQHRDIVLYKDSTDIFAEEGGNPFAEKVIETINPDQVISYGVAADICYDFAVMGMLKRYDFDLYIVSDAIKELPHSSLDEYLNKWESHGAKIIRTEEVKKYL